MGKRENWAVKEEPWLGGAVGMVWRSEPQGRLRRWSRN